MEEDYRESKLKAIKIRIANVIIDLNLIEKEITLILSTYIASKQTFFVTNILLNNHIVSFSNKVKILQYIIKEEKMDIPVNFFKSLYIIMSKRNVLAHSDSVLDDFEVSDVDTDYDDGIITYWPTYVEADPGAWIFSDGKINFETVDKIILDFEKYHNIVKPKITEISSIIRFRYSL